MPEKETPWMQTYTSKKVVIAHPSYQVIDIRDIAHSLALQCRFNGHCREFYSVAQHSVIVASIVHDDLRKQALLHDAAEAYIGDIVRPIKWTFPQISALEKLVHLEICRRFDIYPDIPKEVKKGDNILLATEARDLLGPCPPNAVWETLPRPMDERIDPWSADESECRFLDLFRQLWPDEEIEGV